MNKIKCKILLWIFFIICSAISIFFANKYSKKMMPSIKLEISMNRQQALTKAKILAKKFKLTPLNGKAIAYFCNNDELQSFIELECGGKKTYSNLLKNKLINPYNWHVRIFKEGKIEEINFYFSPTGKSLGFNQKLSENIYGKNIKQNAALKLAKEQSSLHWNTNFSKFKLVNSSCKIKPSKRIDYIFIFEKIKQELNKAIFTLQLTISGNKLSQVTHFVKIPQSFKFRFAKMRVINKNINAIGTLLYSLLYVIGGCLIGVALLYKKRLLIWKQPLILAILVAFLNLLNNLNSFNLIWLHYDTAISAKSFIIQNIFQIIIEFFASILFFFVVIMSAEGLTRQAFGNKIMFWRLASKKTSSSTIVFKQVFIGFIIVGYHLFYAAIIFFIGNKYFSWSFPTKIIFNLDILANYQPWISPIANSIQAGLIEECLFRAIPLAGAAILGNKFGGQKYWIIASFFLQAIVFGSMHASYPVQPGYARVVELIIPSFVFGALYLYFGLLPGIISHTIYDLILMSTPIFLISGIEFWFNKTMIIIIGLSPIIYIIYQRLQSGKWYNTNTGNLNKDFIIQKKHIKKKTIQFLQKTIYINKKFFTITILLLFSITICLNFFGNFNLNATEISITRIDAKKIATNFLKKQKIKINQWNVLSFTNTTIPFTHLYVWQNFSHKTYEKLLTNYLKPSHFIVRFAKFNGSISQRAEEYSIFINGSDKSIVRVAHFLPEDYYKKSLEKKTATRLAYNFLKYKFKLEQKNIKQISITPKKFPQRIDWEFVFNDKNINLEKSLQEKTRILIKISGNSISDSYTTIAIPENWSRIQKKYKTIIYILESTSRAFINSIFLVGIIFSIFRWSKHKFSAKAFWFSFLFLFSLSIIMKINVFPQAIGLFSIQESIESQMLMFFINNSAELFFKVFSISLIIGAIYKDTEAKRFKKNITTILTGLFCGIIVMGFALIVSSFEFKLAPQWGAIYSLGAYSSFLSQLTNKMLIFINRFILFYLFIIFGNTIIKNDKTQKTFILLSILLGITSIGSLGINNITLWILHGIILGIIFYCLYLYFLKFDSSFIILYLAGGTSLSIIEQGIIGGYSGLLIQSFIISIIILILSIIFFLRINIQLKN